VIAGHGRARATPTGGIEHCWDDHGISSKSHSERSPLSYQQSRISRTASPLQMALSLPDGDAALGALGNDTPVPRPEGAFAARLLGAERLCADPVAEDTSRT
jgi:hypothetical protein